MEMIVFNLIVFFNVKVFIFSYLFDPFMFFFLVLVVDLFIIIFYFFHLFFFSLFFFLLRWLGLYIWV